MNRKRVVLILVGLAVLVLGVYVVVRSRGADEALLASGTVEATEAGLGFQVPGRIERVVPNEGDRVRAGDQLAWLDRTELEARRAQAAAQLAAAQAVLAELQAGARSEELAQAREAARAAEERYADAQRDFERVQRLLQGGAVSQEAYDKATLALDGATSQRDQAAQQLKLVETGPRPERIAAQRAAVAQGEAAVQQAQAGRAPVVASNARGRWRGGDLHPRRPHGRGAERPPRRDSGGHLSRES